MGTVHHRPVHRPVVRSWLDQQRDTDHQLEGVPARAEYAGAGMVVAAAVAAAAAVILVDPWLDLKHDHDHEQVADEEALQ